MSWRKKITDNISDVLRFTAYIFLALDGIVLSVFLFWFLAKFLWRFTQYIDHKLFQNPWF